MITNNWERSWVAIYWVSRSGSFHKFVNGKQEKDGADIVREKEESWLLKKNGMAL